jgi:hypothetical protein
MGRTQDAVGDSIPGGFTGGLTESNVAATGGFEVLAKNPVLRNDVIKTLCTTSLKQTIKNLAVVVA